MKKLLFIALALVGAANMASAQAQVALGLKGGLNLAKLDIDKGASNVDNRTGFHAGIFGLVKLTKIGIQPEILYSKQGSKFTFDSKNYEANFDYINVPILLKLYLAAGLNLQLGPQFAFSSNSEIIETAGSIKTTQDVKKLFDKKSDMAVAVGAGWDLPFGLTLDARYNIGLSDVQFKPQNASNPVTFKNQVIQVSLGYKFIKFGK